MELGEKDNFKVLSNFVEKRDIACTNLFTPSLRPIRKLEHLILEQRQGINRIRQLSKVSFVVTLLIVDNYTTPSEFR